jgi:hypothetical protein
VAVNLRRFVRWKIYLDRARYYLAYVQMLMIAGLFYDVLARHFPVFSQHAYLTIAVLVLGIGGGCMVLGWLDTKLGVLDEEIRQLYAERLQAKREQP